MGSADKPSIIALLRPLSEKEKVAKAADSYLHFYSDTTDNRSELDSLRASNSSSLAEQYYDLATDFFEYGWGDSFHFVNLQRGESRDEAFATYQYRIALRLRLSKADKVLDLGCGIGGPARRIAKFSQAHITGLNINDYQLKRARELTAKYNLEHLCDFVKGDFCHAPFDSDTFDAVYSIEATCHAGVIEEVYGEAYRLLKPGCLYNCLEWVMTDNYNPQSAHHQRIKDDIMEGDGLPDIRTVGQVVKAFLAVGFEIVEKTDLAAQSPVPWYSLLMPRWTLSDFKATSAGRWCTHALLVGMEFVGLTPKGSVKVHRTLCKGADGIVKGGKEGIFSPMYLVVARKPNK